jgi:hypothetical protein
MATEAPFIFSSYLFVPQDSQIFFLEMFRQADIRKLRKSMRNAGAS